jgi:hypothetical protein
MTFVYDGENQLVAVQVAGVVAERVSYDTLAGGGGGWKGVAEQSLGDGERDPVRYDGMLVVQERTGTTCRP